MTYRNTERVVVNLLAHSLGSMTHARRLIMRACPVDVKAIPYDCTDPRRRRIDEAQASILEMTKADITFNLSGTSTEMSLGKGVIWKFDRLEIHGMPIPETIMQTMVGRPVTEVVRHPALSDDMIVTGAEQTGAGIIDLAIGNQRTDVAGIVPDADDRRRDRKRRLNELTSSPARLRDDYTRSLMLCLRDRSVPIRIGVTVGMTLLALTLMVTSLTAIVDMQRGALDRVALALATLSIGGLAWVAITDAALAYPLNMMAHVASRRLERARAEAKAWTTLTANGLRQ